MASYRDTVWALSAKGNWLRRKDGKAVNAGVKGSHVAA